MVEAMFIGWRSMRIGHPRILEPVRLNFNARIGKSLVARDEDGLSPASAAAREASFTSMSPLAKTVQ